MQTFTDTLRALARDESGAVLTAELVLVLTICVLALVVGLSELAAAVNGELFDISQAICSLNQSYATPSFFGCRPKGGWFYGSRYVDIQTCGYCQQIVLEDGFAHGSIVTGPSLWTAPAPMPVAPAAPWIAPVPAPAIVAPPAVHGTDCPSCPSPALCPNGNCPPGSEPGLKAPFDGPRPVPTPADKPPMADKPVKPAPKPARKDK